MGKCRVCRRWKGRDAGECSHTFAKEQCTRILMQDIKRELTEVYNSCGTVPYVTPSKRQELYRLIDRVESYLWK